MSAPGGVPRGTKGHVTCVTLMLSRGIFFRGLVTGNLWGSWGTVLDFVAIYMREHHPICTHNTHVYVAGYFCDCGIFPLGHARLRSQQTCCRAPCNAPGGLASFSVLAAEGSRKALLPSTARKHMSSRVRPGFLGHLCCLLSAALDKFSPPRSLRSRQGIIYITQLYDIIYCHIM